MPETVLVTDLFEGERAALLGLLRSLSPREWELPTACSGWTVRDVALHILGGDVGNLSRKRDNASGATVPLGPDFVTRINRHNEIWVEATRRLSPRLIVDLLDFLAPQTLAYFHSVDPWAEGEVIPWAGDALAPAWLDLAREFTERWHHQQHIREAVGRPGCLDARSVSAVLRTFAFALPRAMAGVDAQTGTVATLCVTGDGGGEWSVSRRGEGWDQEDVAERSPAASVTVDTDTAWRLYTKGIDAATARARARIEGDEMLASALLGAVAIIA